MGHGHHGRDLVVTTGKGELRFISFYLARVLHYLSASQQAPKSEEGPRGFATN